MAAGQGYIEFATGDILTAASANGYLASQVVMVFASSAARTSAIASPQEGMLSYLKDTNAVEAYDGAAWISIGSTGDITGVTAGTGISGGGTSGTVTVTNSMATTIDSKGDLIGGTGSDAFARLAVGTNGQVLTADSAETTGLKWASAGSGALTFITSSTFTDSAAVNIDSCFSSTYQNYVIAVNLTNGQNASGPVDLTMQMRTGGTTNSGASYGYSLIYNAYGTTTTSAGATGGTVTYVGYAAQNSRINGVIQMQSPFATQNTTFFGNYIAGQLRAGVFNSSFAATTSFDGFSFQGGSMTGTIRVYGVANA